MNEELIQSAYREHFGPLPGRPILTAAPGRVNLIGEHVDYNDGFVLPIALPLITVAYGEESSDGSVSLFSLSEGLHGPYVCFPSVDEFLGGRGGGPAWISYLRGVSNTFHKDLSKGFKVVIWSSVPLGAGLSSSASLEVAFYSFLECLMNSQAPSPTDKALRCQKAENIYAGVPCGNMDQLASVLGRKDHALLIDCRSLELKYTPLTHPDVLIMILDSNVKHELVGSEYKDRRGSCEAAARALGVKFLRDASLEDLNEGRDQLTEDAFRKGRHVISEIARTLLAYSALEKHDYDTFGRLMIESHASLRDDFEVSCPELDFLVDTMKAMRGVYGSRMTGGGFGGCTVSIIQRSKAEIIKESILKKYEESFGRKANAYVCKPEDGARKLC